MQHSAQSFLSLSLFLCEATHALHFAATFIILLFFSILFFSFFCDIFVCFFFCELLGKLSGRFVGSRLNFVLSNFGFYSFFFFGLQQQGFLLQCTEKSVRTLSVSIGNKYCINTFLIDIYKAFCCEKILLFKTKQEDCEIILKDMLIPMRFSQHVLTIYSIN